MDEAKMNADRRIDRNIIAIVFYLANDISDKNMYGLSLKQWD
jgi:hypothetical protein